MDVEETFRESWNDMGGRQTIKGWSKNDQIHTNKHETTEEHI